MSANLRSRLDRLTRQIEPLSNAYSTDGRRILLEKVQRHVDRLRSQPGYIEPTPEQIDECRERVDDWLNQRFGRRNRRDLR
jgi:hypothetical protein